MANEIVKEIKTRIALRTGDYAYWTTGAGKDIELLKGEVCVCTIAVTDNQAQTAPTVLFKVCDVTGKKFADLKWTSALAADVYEWAKTANLYIETDGAGNAITSVSWDATLNGNKGGLKFTKGETFATKGELEELREGLEADTNTTYNFSIPTDGEDKGKLLVEKKEIGETSWTKVDAYDFVTPGELDEILNGKIHTEEEIKAMEIAHATAAGKVDTAITVKVGGADVVFDGSEAKTADVDAAINAAIDAIPDPVDYTITCADTDYDATEDAPAFKRHTLTQNGKQVCVIDIPRDLVLKSGHVDAEKDELVLVLVNDEEVRVDVKHLIEYVTGGTATDGMITVTVDDNFVATATINDGTITEAKLHADVTAKLNKQWATTEQGATADSALQSVTIAGKTLTKAGDTSVSADEIATALDLANKYQAKGNYASAEQGEKADTALQEITTTESQGLKVSTKENGTQNIDIDTDVVFVLDCNW